jgi:hypothetical protein
MTDTKNCTGTCHSEYKCIPETCGKHHAKCPGYSDSIAGDTEESWEKEFDRIYGIWIEDYVCHPEAFDMDLRHSIAQDELKDFIKSERAKAKEKAYDACLQAMWNGATRDEVHRRIAELKDTSL